MQPIDSIHQIADGFDAIVFDQWGVLHNGSAPYAGAVDAVHTLSAKGVRMAVLSNSGKRAEINQNRITSMGFAADAFEQVMTSGEALWQDMEHGALQGISSFYPITAAPQDAENWRGTLPVTFVDAEQADAILLMGLPDDADHSAVLTLLTRARTVGKRLICSNPDKASPRVGGKTVQSPGALAHAYADAGGDVVFYGKPYPAVFSALAHAMTLTTPARILMVGDSPEHDIAGAQSVHWKSLFIQGGLHAGHDGPADDLFTAVPPADFILPELR